MTMRFLTYTGLTNAKMQLAVHPKIKVEQKDPLMKDRATNIIAARKFHEMAKWAVYKMEEKNVVDEIILRIDGMGIRAKTLETRDLDRFEISRKGVEDSLGEFEAVKVELEKMVEEKFEVEELVTRVEEQIEALEKLLRLGNFQSVDETQVPEVEEKE